MTPFFSSLPMNIINARAEGDKNLSDNPFYHGANSIFLKKEFRKPMQSQRCLVIADAYYEWSDSNKPYLIFLQNKNRPFGFAGVYDRWKNPETGEMVSSFAIITTTANGLLQSIGVKRMPVILSQSNELEWIKSSQHLCDVLKLLAPFPEDSMNAYPMSEKVNNQRVNEVSMLNPTGEKLQVENQPMTLRFGHWRRKERPHSDTTWAERKIE